MAWSVSTLLRLSVGVALATMALKASAWWLTGSVSLLSDALESGVNLAGAVFALAMVAVAARPPDDEHPYGHHKAEYFASGFEGLLIVVAAVGIGVASVQRLLDPQPLASVGWGLGLSVLSSLFNGALAAVMWRTAKQVHSVALEADARHLFTDVWTSVGVLVGLVGVHFTGWLWLDPVVALAVALNILREGMHLMALAVDGLMDHALEPQWLDHIHRTARGFEHDGVRIDHVASRRAGARRHVELHLHLPGTWPLSRASALRQELTEALQQGVPGLRAQVLLWPTDQEPHAGP